MSAGPMEKDTCRDYVLPLLTQAGWTRDQIQEQFPITEGRIIIGDMQIGVPGHQIHSEDFGFLELRR